jgi:starch-binding outer membrane protein, SusD/RagB family
MTSYSSSMARGWRHVATRMPLRAMLLGAVVLGACDVSKSLEVRDPDIIQPTDVESPAGANGVRIGAIARLNFATSGGSGSSEGLFLLSGLLTDEWINGDSFIARQEIDQRVITEQNNFLTDVDRLLNRARLSGAQAVQLLRQYNPNGPVAEVAEMYFVQGYVENALAENYCNGIVLSTVQDGAESYGSPQSYNAVYAAALAHADSGLALITGTTTTDVRVRNALRILKGRILVNLARPAEAAVAVAGVPTAYRYVNFHSQTTRDNQIWALNNVGRRYSVANNEGTNGLNFVSANDPRLPTCAGGDAVCTNIGVTIRTRDDAGTPFNVQRIWPSRDSSVTLSGGIEARLIEAEGALRGSPSDPALYIQKLSQARTESGLAGLGVLVDPVTDAGRVDLLFRERAFWMYSTGHRLGDMRRLIRQYGRAANAVFPIGAWHKGGNYGGDVNLPIPQAERNNPNFPAGASTCTDRAA